VSAGAARSERRSVTERALVSLERGEHDAALGRRVTVVEEVSRHGSSFVRAVGAHIGASP
jgi:hypothetical protein